MDTTYMKNWWVLRRFKFGSVIMLLLSRLFYLNRFKIPLVHVMGFDVTNQS